MWVDPYMFVTLASGIALIAFAGQLCGIYIPYGEETSKLRIARAILAVSYLILSVPPFLELAAGGMPDKELIAIFTVAVAAFQSLLFTTTLLTLLNPKYVERKKVTVQISAVTFAVAIYIALAVTVDSIWVFAAASAAYIAQLTYYTVIFHQKYVAALRKLEEYYDEDEQSRLSWAQFGFFAALTVGVLAFFSTWLTPSLYNVFTVLYTLFYGWFAIRFGNYVAKVNFYLPAVMSPEEPAQGEKVSGDIEVPEIEKEHLRIALDRWVEDMGFARPDEGKEQVVQSLGTTKEIFNWYFNHEVKQDFRTWRIALRIGYAKQLISEEPDMSMNDIARKVGYVTKSNFYGHFKRITGETPIEYRQHVIYGK